MASPTRIVATCDPRHHRGNNGKGVMQGANVLFADGSVRFLEMNEFTQALVDQVAEPEASAR